MASLTHTVSGNIVSFKSAARVPIESLKCHFLPVQEGSGDPSPENVRTIAGQQGCTVYKTGKNLFNIHVSEDPSIWTGANNSTAQRFFTPYTKIIGTSGTNYFQPANCTYSISGEILIINASSGYGLGFAFHLIPNETYTISYTKQDDKMGIAVSSYNKNGDFYKVYEVITNDVVTFTVPSDSEIILITFRPRDRQDAYKVDIPLTNIQLEKGNKATEYEPYQGQTIPITFPVLGKNKLNPEAEWNKTGKAYRYTYIPNLDQQCIVSFIEKDSSIDLTGISVGFSYFEPTAPAQMNPGYRWIIESGAQKNPMINTVKSGTADYIGKFCKYFVIYPNTDEAYDKVFNKYDIQIEYGDIATAYEPYNPDNTVYGGYVDIAKGELVAEYASYTFTGSEKDEFVYVTTKSLSNDEVSERHSFNTAIFDNIAERNSTLDAYCNIGAPNIYNLGRKGNIIYYIGTPSQQVNLSIDSSLCEPTAESFSQWLSEHPLQLVYKLATPVTYPLTPTQLTAFLNANNIWSNTNSNTEVSYAIHDSAPIRAAKQRIAAFNARKIADLKNILRSNYLPNGATWVDEVDIDFDAGDYIEASIDISGCTGVKENILSIGSVIDTWAVANSPSHVSGTEDIVVHFYYPSTSGGTELANDLTYTAVADGTETKHSRNLNKITLSDTTLIIKIDKNNVYVNGTEIITGNLIYTAMTIFQAKTKLLVGSLEGSNRSHATYNYIKVVRGQ